MSAKDFAKSVTKQFSDKVLDWMLLLCAVYDYGIRFCLGAIFKILMVVTFIAFESSDHAGKNVSLHEKF